MVYPGDNPVDMVDPTGMCFWGAVGNWVSHKALGCVGDVVFSIGGGLVTLGSTIAGATGIGLAVGVGLLALGVGAVGYGVRGAANGGCG